MTKSTWLPTKAQQAEIDDHWAKVRAGLYKPEPHTFGHDARSTIAAHRYRAGLLIEQAARHAQIAIDLADMDAAS